LKNRFTVKRLCKPLSYFIGIVKKKIFISVYYLVDLFIRIEYKPD